MLLRTYVAMPVLEGMQNIPFDSGVAVSATVDDIQLCREDIIMGVTVVSASARVMPSFGATPQFTKTITADFSADGVITANGSELGDDGRPMGIVACRFDFSIAELTSTVPRAFLMTVTDSLGRDTSYASGFLVPVVADAPETPVDHVVISPNELLDVPLGETVQLAAAAYDASDQVLPGRVTTYSTSDDQVATVNAIGLVSAVGLGPVTITATSGGESAHAQLEVINNVLMFCSFTDADGTDLDGWACDTGQVLTVHSGAAEVQGNRARTTAETTVVTVPTGTADGRYEILFQSPPEQLIVLFRYTDNDNCVRLKLNVSLQTYDLYSYGTGYGFELLSTGPAAWASPSLLGIDLNGANLAADLNGVPIFSGVTEPANLSADRVGFWGPNEGNEVDSMQMAAP